MRFPVYKYGLFFRLVEETDAAFILDLRTNKNLARHLTSTDDDLQKQVEWIREYKTREKSQKEYYFLFEDENHQPSGVVRLYDINDDTYTSGSWLAKPGSDEFLSIKSDLFISDFAAEELKGKKCVFDVRKKNKKVLRYHKMFSTVIGEDDLNYYFTIDEENALRKYNFLKSII
ncbi:GNAT family N-acetyltransferase [Mucilaginibacter segetis]|uniref:GNAT family N-acetyltransferase n=1 Tax=Mucilaginibacter segetis TaxID=2793071 RepID=A0A934PPA3_9SPHI|nr:GNAT family N-acetyltransferase [Mucilaginibacter segetis]MBK0378213.1 GNAT family N-acetyltransferase [Mucilaginibacter segetis]